MSVELLFKRIRHNDVVFWIGSGFSFYAGYPSVKELKQKIFQELLPEEKANLSLDLPLEELAEKLVRNRSGKRKSLVEVVSKAFSHKPLTKEYHEKLSKIPHVRTLVTTNYDRLIEESFNDLKVISENQHVPYFSEKSRVLFKIHGDYSNPDSILITKQDYIDFFAKDKKEQPLWIAIRNLLCTKPIVFIGFSLEDYNIRSLFVEIQNDLKHNLNDVFFVAPNLNDSEKEELIRHNIKYINLTGEEFTGKLLENIQDNIVQDLEEERISVDLFNKFLNNHELIPTIKATDKGNKIAKIEGVKDKGVYGKLKFSVKGEPEDFKEFNDFLQGKGNDKFIIEPEQLASFEMKFGEINLPKHKDSKFQIQFRQEKIGEGKYDIRFENGFEVLDLPFISYSFKKGILFESFLKTATIKTHLSLESDQGSQFKFSFTFNHDKFYSSTKEEIELFTLLKNFASSLRFYILFNEEEVFTNKAPLDEYLLNYAKSFLQFFEDLRKIEKCKSIKFRNFQDITEQVMQNVSSAAFYLTEEDLMDWNGEIGTTPNDNFNLNDYNQIEISKSSLVVQEGESKFLNVFGKEIEIGVREYEILEPYFVNLQDFTNGVNENLIIKSKVNKVKIRYVLPTLT